MRQDQWSVSMVGLPASIKQISNVLKMTGGIGLLVLSGQHLAIPARASADKVFDTCTEAQIGQVVSRWWDSVLCQWQPGEIWMGPTDKPRLPKAISTSGGIYGQFENQHCPSGSTHIGNKLMPAANNGQTYGASKM